jgi:hypothetical protein
MGTIITTEEKLTLIDNLDHVDKLEEEHFKLLASLSSDKDAFVRSRCAAQLVNFENNESLELLVKLTSDKDSLVRTEAYDSLSIFKNQIVEEFLKKAIVYEKNKLARSYAILSWIDVLASVRHVSTEDIAFLQNRKIIDKSSDCRLCCSYGLYVYGVEEELVEILSHLKNSDYLIRCSAITLLNEIRNVSNENIIKEAIDKLLLSENSVAVRERAVRFLDGNR